MLAARKLPHLEQVAQGITQMGRRALPVSANIRYLPEIDNLVKRSVDESHHVDILVNNAQTNPVFGSVFDIDKKAWDITMGVNLKGYFFLSKAVGKVMREKGGGTIINLSSVGGIRSHVGLGVYSISKAGIIMLTQVLAQEWGQYNIRVNTIAPGLVKARLSEALWNNLVFARETEELYSFGVLS